jgi:hypothetical protein
MSVSTKLLPMLALLVSMGPFAAQAHAAPHHEAMLPTPKSWVVNFGFLPNNAASHCTDAQTGFWPRPLHCGR